MYENRLYNIKCPECGGHITYNGNYFCQEGWEEDSDCRWSLDAGIPPAEDEAVIRSQIRAAMSSIVGTGRGTGLS